MSSASIYDDDVFTIEVSEHDGATVVAPIGELDVRTAHELEERFGTIGSPPLVIVDLAETRFIDSFALHLLIREHKRVTGEGRRFAISRDTGIVEHLLHVTGLDEIFERTDLP